MKTQTIQIAHGLQRNAGLRGWFSLELQDPLIGRITRLGFTQPGTSAEYLSAQVGNTGADHTGSGWVFARGYEDVHAVLGGYVPASVVFIHATDEVRVEGIDQAAVSELQHIVDVATAQQHFLPSVPTVNTVEWRDTDEQYLDRIRACVERLEDNEGGVLCLTNRATVSAVEPIDPLSVFAALQQSSAAPRAGIIVEGDRALVSASPETFLEVRDAHLSASPMKGTRARGSTPERDEVLKEDLRTSPKELRENTAVAQAVCNEFAEVCEPESVRVTALCRVQSFAHVHQMVSDVGGTLKPGTVLADVLKATFPAASMTGVSKIWAIETLQEFETGNRGLYSGCYGWVSESGHEAQIAMAIRCTEISGATACVGAGGGLMRDSDPASELAELKLKAGPVLTALGAGYP